MKFNVLLFPAIATLAAAHCTPTILAKAVDSYLQTQGTGKISDFVSLFDNSTWLGYYENAVKVNISNGILTKPLPITHNHTIYDTTGCATYSEVVVDSDATPYVLGTQIRFANHKINKIETVVTKPGDWLFNVTGYQHWVTHENWSTIIEQKRDTRDTIKKAADAYLDVFNNPNVTVPWGIPCVRLEGGAYGNPGPNGTCAGGVPSGVPLTNRRYVIDETVGSVDVMIDFGTHKWPDTHEFRIENGKIRYVHTMTHCGIANCGVGNGTFFSNRLLN